MSKKKAARRSRTTRKRAARKKTTRKSTRRRRPKKKAAQQAASGSKVARSRVINKVIKAIRAEAVRNDATAGKLARLDAKDETLNLTQDLKIPASRRRALSRAYKAISTSFTGGRTIGRTSAGKATTVKAAIDLVHARANGRLR